MERKKGFWSKVLESMVERRSRQATAYVDRYLAEHQIRRLDDR